MITGCAKALWWLDCHVHQFVDIAWLCNLTDWFIARVAPEDDEPTTSDEEADVAEAREDIRAGRTRSWEDVRHELGAATD